MLEQVSLAPSEPAVRAESPEALYALLAERISRYTMGDSTSVPLETAQRLLEGIVYCAALHRKSGFSGVPKDAPLSERYRAGIAEAKRLARRAKLLLGQARRWQPPVVNIGFRETLAALPGFFRQYDAEFFAQEIPCSIDYPLCHPVSDSLPGVEYLLDYLKRWLAESTFLRAFSSETLTALYERYYGDYNDLLVNLYLPAAEMAVLCALAEQPVRELALSHTELDAVQRRLQNEEETARIETLAAADRALAEINVEGAFEREYLRDTALDFLIRIRAAHTN